MNQLREINQADKLWNADSQDNAPAHTSVVAMAVVAMAVTHDLRFGCSNIHHIHVYY